MDHDQDQSMSDDEMTHSPSDDDEAQRFGGQVRNTTGGKELGAGPRGEKNAPQGREEGQDVDDDLDNFQASEQRYDIPPDNVLPSASDTDLDSDIERGV